MGKLKASDMLLEAANYCEMFNGSRGLCGLLNKYSRSEYLLAFPEYCVARRYIEFFEPDSFVGGFYWSFDQHSCNARLLAIWFAYYMRLDDEIHIEEIRNDLRKGLSP